MSDGMYMYRNPPIPPVPPPTPPTWQTIPALSVTQGQTLGLSQYLNNPSSVTVTYALGAGSLPNGVTLNTVTGLLTAAAGSTIGTVSGLSFAATF